MGGKHLVCRGGDSRARRSTGAINRLSLKWHAPIASVAALSERLIGLRCLLHKFVGVMPSSMSLRGGHRPTWRPEREARGSALGVQSRSTQPDNRVLPANTAALRDGASRTPPPTRRVRSAGIPGNLQLPKALTERRYRRNRLVRFYRHLVRTGSAFPRLPRRFAPRNDNSGAIIILMSACSVRRCSAGRGMPRPYNARLAALRNYPRSTAHFQFSAPPRAFLFSRNMV